MVIKPKKGFLVVELMDALPTQEQGMPMNDSEMIKVGIVEGVGSGKEAYTARWNLRNKIPKTDMYIIAEPEIVAYIEEDMSEE